ncbi:hypothetical protein JCM19037_592 [Geomicrobium sp. JCM 19037]|uniref:YetF domain-containing protein n=1 Tax=Geomicrobium sp. JCM 19037 TaxID=1460634 RepID=UPI00045F3DC0|nr:DUF421 domain-containing protein [Geomicrobium sp. JCM 19037]GAK02361.1 hypothetical protein JCM19037_592 [Geomicrobium sp. JCM 19037]
MENIFSETIIVLSRIITILPLLLIITLFMGKRSIGELPVFDYLIIITLASVTGADIADPSVPHFHTVFAIIAIAALQKIWTNLSLRYPKFGKKVTFAPTVVMVHGKFLPNNIRSIQYSIDNVICMLRDKNVFYFQEVQYAIIEANGQLSVMKEEHAQPVTKEDMNLPNNPSNLSYPLILDGQFEDENAMRFSMNERDLLELLARRGIKRLKDVYYAEIHTNGNVVITTQNGELTRTSIHH